MSGAAIMEVPEEDAQGAMEAVAGVQLAWG